jgi:hypothetical protein
MVEFNIREEFRKEGYTSLPICQWLTGLTWDDEALAYISAFNPSSIRVTTGMCKLDSRVGRVTVIVNTSNIIQNITMEVVIGLPDGFRYGTDFTLHHKC